MSDNSLFQMIHLPKVGSAMSLEIRVGAGQSGTITITETSGKVTQYDGDCVLKYGNSDELNGREIDFNVVCSDVNTSHNNLLVTVEIEGFSTSSPWTLSRQLTSGGAYQFFGTLSFFK